MDSLYLVHQQVLELVGHVKHYFPAQAAKQFGDELYNRIRKTIYTAAKYNIKTKRDIYKFINISMPYGPDFMECVIIDPDGNEHKGKTDNDGVVRVDGISKGECKVTFPTIHEDSWVKVTA